MLKGQFMSSLTVSPDGSASIHIFGISLNIIPANDLSIRVEYDAMQVVYEGFKRGPVLSGTAALSGKGFVNIGMTLRLMLLNRQRRSEYLSSGNKIPCH